MKEKAEKGPNLEKKKRRALRRQKQKRKMLADKTSNICFNTPNTNDSLADKDMLKYYTSGPVRKMPHIDTSKSQDIFKNVQSSIEESFPQIRPFQHIPIYLIDTDKYDVDIGALAAYQCIRRNLASLETINAERHLDKQLQELYM